MRSNRRLKTAGVQPGVAIKGAAIVEAHGAHAPVDSPARLLHAQLNAGIVAPWHDAATQHGEPRYPGIVRLAIPVVGAAASWAAIGLIVQILR